MLRKHRSIFSVPSFARFNNTEGNTSTTTQDQGDGGDKGGAGGAGEGDKGGEKDKVEMVSKAEFDRVMADLHKHKKTAQTLKEEREAEKLQKQKEQNQWKEIAEAKEREAAEAKAEAQRIQNSFLGEKKFNAVRDAASKLGLRPEAMGDLEMLDLESVQLETTNTGKINILGADKFAESLKRLKPHWFADPKNPSVNGSGQRVQDGNGKVTIDDLLAAEVAAKKDPTKVAAYHEMHKKYQQQR